MTELVRFAAFAASQALSAITPRPQRSHISEICAALLGYNTLAALQVEDADASFEFHLDDAEIIVLDPVRGRVRAFALLTDASDPQVNTIVDACIAGINGAADPTPVYVGLVNFWEDFARDAMADAITSSDEVANGMADSNASFSDDAELPEEVPAADDLWAARYQWSLTAQGAVTGDADTGRPYTGHVLNCQSKLTFIKAGRAGLMSMEAEAFGGIDDTWREQDRQDEEDFWREMELRDRGTSS